MDDIRAGSTGFSAAGYQMHYMSRVQKGADGNAMADQKESPAFVPAPANRWGVFVTGTGEWVNVGNEDINARGNDITTGAMTLGVDYRVTNSFDIGLSGAYARSDADLVSRGHVGVDGGGGGMTPPFSQADSTSTKRSAAASTTTTHAGPHCWAMRARAPKEMSGMRSLDLDMIGDSVL